MIPRPWHLFLSTCACHGKNITNMGSKIKQTHNSRDQETLAMYSSKKKKETLAMTGSCLYLEGVLVGAVVTDVHREDVAAVGESCRRIAK
jgi:hypothetical protein